MSTRKDEIEKVVRNGKRILISTGESALAWRRFMDELEAMTEPEARNPKFAGILRAIWAAATNEQS